MNKSEGRMVDPIIEDVFTDDVNLLIDKTDVRNPRFSLNITGAGLPAGVTGEYLYFDGINWVSKAVDWTDITNKPPDDFVLKSTGGTFLGPAYATDSLGVKLGTTVQGILSTAIAGGNLSLFDNLSNAAIILDADPATASQIKGPLLLNYSGAHTEDIVLGGTIRLNGYPAPTGISIVTVNTAGQLGITDPIDDYVPVTGGVFSGNVTFQGLVNLAALANPSFMQQLYLDESGDITAGEILWISAGNDIYRNSSVGIGGTPGSDWSLYVHPDYSLTPDQGISSEARRNHFSGMDLLQDTAGTLGREYHLDFQGSDSGQSISLNSWNLTGDVRYTHIKMLRAATSLDPKTIFYDPLNLDYYKGQATDKAVFVQPDGNVVLKDAGLPADGSYIVEIYEATTGSGGYQTVNYNSNTNVTTQITTQTLREASKVVNAIIEFRLLQQNVAFHYTVYFDDTYVSEGDLIAPTTNAGIGYAQIHISKHATSTDTVVKVSVASRKVNTSLTIQATIRSTVTILQAG